jgi:hypothetical protein
MTLADGESLRRKGISGRGDRPPKKATSDTGDQMRRKSATRKVWVAAGFD